VPVNGLFCSVALRAKYWHINFSETMLTSISNEEASCSSGKFYS
jgi:hypothetical protein